MPGSNLRLLGVLSALALGACGGGDRSGGGAAKGDDVPDSLKYGGTAVIATYGDLQSMNALVSSDFNSNSIQREVLFMPLVKYNERLEPIPWLAERVDTAQAPGDSLDITFHLRRDVKWHDGQPTTARDVEFTFLRAVDPATAFPNASGFDYYNKTPQVADDYTIRFRLRPHSDFLDIFYQTAVMPRHILGEVAPAQLLTHPFGTTSPVGNGPFRFVRRVPGQEWVFEANPEFPAGLGGRPRIDRLVYRNIPEQTTLLTELITGRIDIYTGLNPNQSDQVKNTRNVRLIDHAFRQWVWIAWNTRLPQFSDARVRRALTMAIDRQQIVDALLYGYGEVGRSTVTPAHWSYDNKDPQTLLPYDTAAARRLLTEAGWIDRNNDGVLENAQGVPFRFTLKTNQGNDTRKDITEIVQAQLGRLGIQVEPQLVENNTLVDQLQGSLNARGERVRQFDAVVHSWVDFFRKDDADILLSRNLDKPFQYVGYANPRADELIDTVGVTVDREVARPYWREYQHLMVQESPYTVLYYPRRLAGVSTRLREVEMDTRGEYTSILRWWIHPSDRRGLAAATTPAARTDSAAGDTAKK